MNAKSVQVMLAREQQSTNAFLSEEEPEPAAQLVAAIQARREAKNAEILARGDAKAAAPVTDLKRNYDSINARLDEPVKRAEVDPDAVDRFVTAVWQGMVEEKLARAEQSAWEKRMDINAVLDPVPVRVDARMRPDR